MIESFMSTKVVLFVELYKFYENYLHVAPLYLLALCAEILLISFGSLHSPYVLRNKLPPLCILGNIPKRNR